MYRSQWIMLWLMLFLFDATAAVAESPPTFTMQEAHRMAMGNYQLIGAMREQVEQARQTRREARSLLLPTIYTQAVLTRNMVSAELEFEDVKLRILPANDYNLALVVSQPIFSGQRILTAKKQADIGVDVAGKSYETTAQDSLLDVTQAFYLALAIQENIDITRRSVEVTAETLRQAQKEPEKYSDLIVRVAGYSDYFNDLGKDLQDEIIKRTEHQA